MLSNNRKNIWTATAASNIALIKYAGKKDSSNLPLNSSLSYTLNSFITKVEISRNYKKEDEWQVLENIPASPKESIFFWNKNQNLTPQTASFYLSQQSIKRFLNHFQFLKKIFDITGYFYVKSINNFPDSIGAASSASSFCALTKATYQLALFCSSNKEKVKSFTPSCLSILSRQGSGSSCRSFFQPWALWEAEGARLIQLPYKKLIHQLIVVDNQKKTVSSSLAHEKIKVLPEFNQRIKRAKERLSNLLSALNNQNWRQCFEISWEEFEDLHRVYESAGIYYRKKASFQILDTVKNFWEKEGDGPLVTMDAGSSVHLLYRPDQKKLASFLLNIFLEDRE